MRPIRKADNSSNASISERVPQSVRNQRSKRPNYQSAMYQSICEANKSKIEGHFIQKGKPHRGTDLKLIKSTQQL